ncbi:hypothetical protein Dimus_011725 [Dionaea muscipula]
MEKSAPIKLMDPVLELGSGGGVAHLISCDDGLAEQQLHPDRSSSPCHVMDGAQRTIERSYRNTSVEMLKHERGSDQSRSSSRRIVEDGHEIDDRVSGKGPRTVELRRRYDYHQDIDYDSGMNLRSKHSCYYDENEIPVSHRSGDWVQLRSSPSDRVDRIPHMADRVLDKGSTPMVMHMEYDYHEKVDYADEKHLRMKRAYYDDEIHNRHDPSDRVYSRSSPPRRVEGGSQFVESVSHKSGQPMESSKRYDYTEDMDFDTQANLGRKQTYYRDDEIPVSGEDCRDRKFLASDDHRTSVNGLNRVEEGSIRQVARVRVDSGFTSDNRESRRGYSALDKLKHEDSDVYQNEMPPRKSVVEGHYRHAENYAYHSRDASYPCPPRSLYKNFDDEHLERSNSSISTRIMKKNGSPGNQRDVFPSTHDGYRKSHGEPLESSGGTEYPRRLILTHMGDYEVGHSDIKCRECDICNSSMVQREDYVHHNLVVKGEDHSAYIPYNGFHEKMPAYDRADNVHRDFPRAAVAYSMTERPLGAGYSRRILRNSDFQEADLISKENYPEYIDTRQRLDTMKQTGDRLETTYKKVHEPDYAGDREELGWPGYKPSYRRSGIAESHVERMSGSLQFEDGEEMERLKRDDHEIYHKHAKRKYDMDKEIGAFDARSAVPRKLNTTSSTKSNHDSGEEWTGRNSNDFHTNEPSGHRRNHYLETEQIFDEIDHYRSSVKDNWSPHQSRPKSMLRHSGNPLKSWRTSLKGYREPESSNAIGRTHHVNRRGVGYIPNKVWRRSDSNIDVLPSDVSFSEDLEGPFKHDPSEETESFKQMVHTEFLNFYKKLNENTDVRKLYKEDGKAGSLFCMVCGRRSSKEFLNTQRLVIHAYMSRKANLRAQHLGLHKAVSVLMGWHSAAASDIITWVPHPLPEVEVAAQKEDLILWPPVVIVHNISLSYKNHKEWSVVSIDDLGEFMRSKGFNQGKMTICLGNPGDQSIILVKFLGTFSGLREAERFHNYFSQSKHGRTDIEQVVSAIDQNNPIVQVSTLAEKVESLLYGYMAIAEDLDRIDFSTKKRCLVKSKKEIQDLAEAPVKPE